MKTIKEIQRPKTKKEMLSFLGLVNFCQAWISDFASYDAVLRAATLKDNPSAILWTDEMRHEFRHLKYRLCSAPALGLPDYKLTFHLHVSDDGETAVAVLAQMHGERPRPVA
ncbi:hypothetical protein F2P81_024056 [Scophthalmus maximus]|uniref:Reverse transcriptase/retrotransposon-derived protein RNase H-like domain-containing protein n=1 Tax=Scophthalmus maximus TaxID=52904 RepID=A0A6A4RLR1_SCOMX|nr:hypothetical protein F2P81_024056 [Scophthalmus maximus]